MHNDHQAIPNNSLKRTFKSANPFAFTKELPPTNGGPLSLGRYVHLGFSILGMTLT